MNKGLMFAALVLLGADPLASTKVGALSLKAPSDWTRTDEGEGASWALKDGTAKLELSVYPVNPRRDAQACVDQLLEAVGKDGFEAIKVGGAPAGRKVTTDFVGEGEEAKVDKNKVNTVTVIGCDGNTKFVLTLSSPAPKASRFGPLLKRVLDSVKYGAGT